MKLTLMKNYSITYNILKRRPVSNESKFLPLYKSTVFQGIDLQHNLNKAQSSKRFKQILPQLLLSQSNAYPAKILVTEMHFNQETQTVKIVSLRPRGIVSQQFHIDKIVPLTYADMRGIGRLPQPDLPTYIDDTMTYANTFNDQIYIFEQDGKWIEETVNHPKLKTQNLLVQKQWFDRKNAFI